MLTNKRLDDYAKLVLTMGVNLQKGQGLEIVCPVEKKEIANALTLHAYQMGAKLVRVRWTDETTDRLGYEYADASTLMQVPKWVVMAREELVEKGFCYVAVSAENPNAFSGIDQDKLAVVAKSRAKALKKFSDSVMSNDIRWCVISAPTLEWAKQVFPNQPNPEEALSQAIEKTMRLDAENPLLAWQTHVDELERRAKFLNDKNFSYLRFQSANGTDLTVGLCDDHQWLSAKEYAKDGVWFIANLPTEEVFTAPHKNRVDGVVKSALPLVYNGNRIEDFSITFKKGKVVDFSARVGYDTLKALINLDKGCSRLGEVALIGKNSPIAKSNVLFYNTLFDENASCHLAFGKGYPTTVKNGDSLTKKQLSSLGLNDSIEHEDFMIGSPDVNVTGVDAFGKKTPLMKDGDWVI